MIAALAMSDNVLPHILHTFEDSSVTRRAMRSKLLFLSECIATNHTMTSDVLGFYGRSEHK